MKGMFLWGSGGRLTTIVNIVVISVHHCIARCIVHRRIMRFVLVEVIQPLLSMEPLIFFCLGSSPIRRTSSKVLVLSRENARRDILASL